MKGWKDGRTPTVVDSQRWTKGHSIGVAPKGSTSFAFMAIGVKPRVH